ncbi:MAG: MFS transporter [Betaproteobacteria bacterium]|nr:MFS transporter [Betaproteobacteria bacterium]
MPPRSSSNATVSTVGTDATRSADIDSDYAWLRLWLALALSTLGAVGMWSVVVALPAVQAEFGVARADASLPYTLTMIGFAAAGLLVGRASDRVGIFLPVAVSIAVLSAGFLAASFAGSLWMFALAQGIAIGTGCAATFAPLLADTSLWFARRRGLAVGIFASGNYLGGVLWPPVIQHFIATSGWRATYAGIAVFCLVAMLPLSWVLRRRSPAAAAPAGAAAIAMQRPLGLRPSTLQTALLVAGVACCVAMSMPQVHLVAYCADLGYGPARGAEMLSLMLGFGIVSRLASGWISDRIGGLKTLLLGSTLQGAALLLFLPFDGLVPLYIVSALFGLSQGGIVPSYAMIIRAHFPPAQAGARISATITATIVGMALGGWMSGAIFDLTGGYRAAFLNGTAWNVLNMVIAIWLLRRASSVPPQGGPAPATARA